MTTSAMHSSDIRAALSFTLADRLSKALAYGDVTIPQMAEAIDRSERTVGNYTSGRTMPDKLVVKEWAIRTGVPLVWLQTGRFPDEGTKKGPASEETGPLLPEMDSNHQPAGYSLAPKTRATLAAVPAKTNVTRLPKRSTLSVATGNAIVTDFAVTQ